MTYYGQICLFYMDFQYISYMDRDISFEAVRSKAATSVTFVLIAILWHTIPLTWGCGVREDEEEGGNIH